MSFILEERFILVEDNKKPVIKLDYDWATAYASCKTKEDFAQFWHGGIGSEPRQELEQNSPQYLGYFKYTWGENAGYIEKLGYSLMNSLVTLGWTPDENPFIAFLTNIISDTLETNIRIQQITPISFGSLYKAATDGQLSAADLINGGKLGKYNIIYNPNFYLSVETDQKAYIKAQNKFLQIAAQYGLTANAFANIYSISGNLNNLNSVIGAGQGLRKPKDIYKIFSAITNKDEDESDGLDDVDDAPEAVTNLLARIKSKAEAQKTLAYLYDVFNITTPVALTIADKETSGFTRRVRDSISVTSAETEYIRKIFKIPKVKYNQKYASEILIGLAKIAGYNQKK